MSCRFLYLCLICLGISACTAVETKMVTADFRKQEGLYIVAYTQNKVGRMRVEDRLASDLGSRNIIAVPSYLDIADVTNTTPTKVIAQAEARKLLAVLLINQVAGDASDSIIKNPRRISPLHPTLRAFYEHSKQDVSSYDQNQEVFAEVNLFVLNKGEATLIWSGTTWSFRADGKGAAIGDISATIVDQIARLKARYRP